MNNLFIDNSQEKTALFKPRNIKKDKPSLADSSIKIQDQIAPLSEKDKEQQKLDEKEEKEFNQEFTSLDLSKSQTKSKEALEESKKEEPSDNDNALQIKTIQPLNAVSCNLYPNTRMQKSAQEVYQETRVKHLNKIITDEKIEVCCLQEFTHVQEEMLSTLGILKEFDLHRDLSKKEFYDRNSRYPQRIEALLVHKSLRSKPIQAEDLKKDLELYLKSLSEKIQASLSEKYELITSPKPPNSLKFSDRTYKSAFMLCLIERSAIAFIPEKKNWSCLLSWL